MEMVERKGEVGIREEGKAREGTVRGKVRQERKKGKSKEEGNEWEGGKGKSR